MDNKIKTFTIWAFTICSFILSGCTQNNWADWKVQNELWLANNLKQEGVQVTESGLQYKIIADPTPKDARPNTTSTIVCDYRVTLINGCIVESQGPTFGGTISAKLNLSQVIPGFMEGCRKIHNNGDIELYIPAYLAYDYEKYQSNEYDKAEGYGTEGTSSFIPPYSTLIYVIHLCSVSD